MPTDTSVWKAITTPWAVGTGCRIRPARLDTRRRRDWLADDGRRGDEQERRTVRIAGRVTQGGVAVAGAQVRLLLNGQASKFTARTSAAGAYSVVLKKSGKKSVTTFQARVTVAERDVTQTACASPTVANVPCVSATASAFTAVSSRLRIRL